MNIIELEAAPDSHGTVLFRGGTGSFRLSLTVRPGPITLGVRPEHIRFRDAPSPETVPGVIDVVELAGDHFVVTVETHLGPLVAKVYDGRVPAVKQLVEVGFEEEMLHLFETGSGQRICSEEDMEN